MRFAFAEFAQALVSAQRKDVIQTVPVGRSRQSLNTTIHHVRRVVRYGQLSAIVEPIAAVIGAVAVVAAAPILPYALSFAAGAMVYVVVEELIPESHRQGIVDLATVSLMIGFAVMMVLDVALS